MLVQDFVANRDDALPEEFYLSLPQFCFEEGCGYPMEMTETLTNLHCSNPRCPSKVARRLMAMANNLGVKDLGESKAMGFIKKFGIQNPLIIFQYEPDTDGTIADGVGMEVSQRIVSQFMEKNKFTLSEYVKIANLPFVQTSAMSIFGDYDDLIQAYDDIEKGGIEFITRKLDIGKGKQKTVTDEDEEEIQDISVRALKVYESLMQFKNDLIQGLNGVEIIPTHTEGMKRFKAVCSSQVGAPFRTKADFYATVNNRYPDIHVEFLSAVNSNIDYLVWAGADGSNAEVTNKVKKVRGYNDKYKAHKESGTLKEDEHLIPIVTAAQLLSILDNMSSIELND